MQRTTSRRQPGHRTRLHTIALALVFGLLAVVAVKPHAQPGHVSSTSTARAFPQIP